MNKKRGKKTGSKNKLKWYIRDKGHGDEKKN